MSDNKQLITVIVPIYNVADYLERCIKSIQEQSFKALEIILVDDGSTDNSGHICDEYAVVDERIKVIHKKNGGLSDARNSGLKVASGKWVAFIDSDDYIAKDTLAILHSSALENDCQIAVCNMVRVFEDDTKELFYRPTTEKVVLKAEKRFETLHQPSVCNKLFELRLFDNVQFPRGKYYEDTFVYHILINKAKKVVLTGYDGYFYLSRRGSILGQPQYTNRYFDFVEAVYARAIYLIENRVVKYDVEACLSLYAAVSNAEKYIIRTKDNQQKFLQLKKWYDVSYKYLINRKNVSFKQKIRLVLLKYMPAVHSKIY